MRVYKVMVFPLVVVLNVLVAGVSIVVRMGYFVLKNSEMSSLIENA
jgi:hypothetical protein